LAEPFAEKNDRFDVECSITVSSNISFAWDWTSSPGVASQNNRATGTRARGEDHGDIGRPGRSDGIG